MKAAPSRRRHRRPAFSVVSIVRNEADRIPRLLASLEDFRSRGGEVLILDTGSEDDTARVAKEAGCRVFVEPRRFGSKLTSRQAQRIHDAFSRDGEGPFLQAGERLFNFARARNHAQSLARNNFQFAVDGGDVVEALDIDFVDSIVRSGRHPALPFEARHLGRGGWFLEVRSYFCDRRFFVWSGRAHNFMVPLRAGEPPKRLRLNRQQLFVSHHTDLAKPRDYQLAGVALEALTPRAVPRWEFLLGRELGARGFFRSALGPLLGLDRIDVPPPMRSAALCLAANCLEATGGSGDEVADLLGRATRRDSAGRDAWLHIARHGLAEGDMQGAASSAAAALAIPALTVFPEPEENHGAAPHAILYWALLWLGRRDEARTHFRICLELDPANPVYREHARLLS